jgi:putative flippase GtrA
MHRRLAPLASLLPPASRRRLERLARYASVSAVSTAVGLSTLAVLVDVGHWPAGWANAVATGLGTIPSFELNRRWVWGRHGQRSLRREVAPFVLLCLVELVASSLAVHAAAQWTAAQGWSEGARTAVDLAANLATYGLLWVAQYVICDRALFGRRTVTVASGDGPEILGSVSGADQAERAGSRR